MDRRTFKLGRHQCVAPRSAAHVLRLDYAFHSSHTQGELIERVDGDVGNLSRFFSRFVIDVVGNGVLILGILALLCVSTGASDSP